MDTWHLATYDETWAFLRAGIEHAFDPVQKADPQRPCAQELSRVVREVVQVRRWEKALYESLRDEPQARAERAARIVGSTGAPRWCGYFV